MTTEAARLSSAPSPPARPRQPSLADKVNFLRRGDTYVERPSQVEARESHMSWVFLTATHAYKLKKAVRHPYLDYSTLDLRFEMCRQELLLNRRLANWVYLGLAALVQDSAGGLALTPSGAPIRGTVVEWLVQMHRLPDRMMLDQAIRADTTQPSDLRRSVQHLARFFSRARGIDLTGQQYLIRLRQRIEAAAAAVESAGVAGLHLSAERAHLLAFVDAREDLLVRRATAGKIVEGHGDLRPEHVFLGEPPAVIDCIEFSRELRTLDPADELSYLWMECARLGAESTGERFFAGYRRESGDRVPGRLIRFYMSLRACQRAQLALGHLDGHYDPAPWIAKAAEYVDIAARCAAEC